VALAAVTALALGGCAPAPAGAMTNSRSLLTFSEARQAYQHYLQVTDEAAQAGAAVQGLSVVGDAQWSIVKAQYTALAMSGRPVPTYRYGQPTFYVPALDSYSLWFVAAVVTRTTGHSRTIGTTLLLFEKRGPRLPWTVDEAPVLHEPLPAIVRDRDGYATAVSTSDPDLLLPPNVVGATQGAVVDDGPASPAAAVLDDGPLTTGLYQAEAAQARTAAATNLDYQWLLEGTNYALFSLRTAGGGALVFYGMDLNTITEHADPQARSPIPVPAGFRSLLRVPTEVGHKLVDADWTFEFAAVDPPSTARGVKLQVIASEGWPTNVQAG
jgi:hypothetical protein